MQHQQTRGPLSTPKAFRRPTGAHAIIVSILFADLAGTLIWLLLSTFAWLPLWWLARRSVTFLHASLFLDVALVLIAASVATGIIRRHMLKKNAGAAWGPLFLFIVVLMTVALESFLIDRAVMSIPASALPAFSPAPFPWPIPPSLLGAEIAAGLCLLAHIVVWRRERRAAAEQLLSFSRAHPEGNHWNLLEEVYRLYRRGLSRFEHPPVWPLRTPPMFYYFPPVAELDNSPEQGLYWKNGELVINQAYLGAKQEQTDILLPLLARLLHDYNSPDHLVEWLFRLARVADASALWAWVFWLPSRVASTCERQWFALERDRVLDYDRFAYWCGEGKRLRRLLQSQLAERIARKQPDNAVPTLAERIDHLDSLIGREARQVKEL